jgi:hypothetical protein
LFTSTSHYEYDVWLLQNAVVRGTLLGLKYMGKDEGGKGGVVVNMASVASLTSSKSFPIYFAIRYRGCICHQVLQNTPIIDTHPVLLIFVTTIICVTIYYCVASQTLK